MAPSDFGHRSALGPTNYFQKIGCSKFMSFSKPSRIDEARMSINLSYGPQYPLDSSCERWGTANANANTRQAQGLFDILATNIWPIILKSGPMAR